MLNCVQNSADRNMMNLSRRVDDNHVYVGDLWLQLYSSEWQRNYTLAKNTVTLIVPIHHLLHNHANISMDSQCTSKQRDTRKNEFPIHLAAFLFPTSARFLPLEMFSGRFGSIAWNLGLSVLKNTLVPSLLHGR